MITGKIKENEVFFCNHSNEAWACPLVRLGPLNTNTQEERRAGGQPAAARETDLSSPVQGEPLGLSH